MEFLIFCAGLLVTLIVAFGVLVGCVFVGNDPAPPEVDLDADLGSSDSIMESIRHKVSTLPDTVGIPSWAIPELERNKQQVE